MEVTISIDEFTNYSETSYYTGCPLCGDIIWMSFPEIGDEIECDCGVKISITE